MKKYKLGKVCNLNERTISRLDNVEIEYLDTGSITENCIASTQRVLLFDAPSRAQRLVKHHTIIYSLVRPKLGHHGIMDSPSNNLVISTGFATIDIKDEFKKDIDPYYLYIYLTQNHITQHLNAIAENSVSAYPALVPKNLADQELRLPSLVEQRRIGEMFSTIDQKIALNRAINHNLEAMAKQLYDYWFVQFDFPDENGKPYKSSGGKMVWNEKLKREIPASWEAKLVNDIAEVFNGATPSTTDEQNYGGNVVWITPKDLSDQKQKFVYHGERNISQMGYTSCSTHLLPINAILMSSRAPIGLLAIAKKELCTNQGFKNVVPKEESMAAYMYYYLQTHIKQIEQLGTGTTFKEVSREDILKFPILKPCDEVLNLWEKKVTAINDKQLELQKENENLTKLRDELLPLLMNGQVSVNYDLSNDRFLSSRKFLLYMM